MNVPENLRYTKDHEWTDVSESGNQVRMGITDYAQDALGDIVFVQLPAVGTKIQAGITMSEVESTKSVSDVYAPVSGVVVEVNSALSDAPQTINEDPYGQGWICVIETTPEAEQDQFLDASAYRALVGDE